MSAKTPSSIIRENAGSLNLLIATFTDVDQGDTYTSGLSSVVSSWFQATDAPSTTTNNYAVVVSESAGVFTFSSNEGDRTGDLFILVRD